MSLEAVFLLSLHMQLPLHSLSFLYEYREQFTDYWVRGNFLTMDLATRIYMILKQPARTYLTQVLSASKNPAFFYCQLLNFFSCIYVHDKVGLTEFDV